MDLVEAANNTIEKFAVKKHGQDTTEFVADQTVASTSVREPKQVEKSASIVQAMLKQRKITKIPNQLDKKREFGILKALRNTIEAIDTKENCVDAIESIADLRRLHALLMMMMEAFDEFNF